MENEKVTVEAYFHEDLEPRFWGVYTGYQEDIEAYLIERFGEGYGWSFKTLEVKRIYEGCAKELRMFKEVKAELEKQIKNVDKEIANIIR
jgi:hypothetical protein